MGLFDSIRLRRPKLNKFNLSHERKLTMNMGDLVPILFEEVLPGDKFRVSPEILIRLAPMLAPVYARCNAKVEFFFVPERLVWNEFENHITGGPDGTLNPPLPYFPVSDANKHLLAKGSLADYMGIPPQADVPVIAPNMGFTVQGFRAYQLIWDNYYRDQNLQPSLNISLAGGPVSDLELEKIMTLRKRAWEKDYFTSALPWAQRGGAVEIPLAGGTVNYMPTSKVYQTSGAPPPGPGDKLVSGGVTAEDLYLDDGTGTNKSGRIENIEDIELEAVTINELRRAVRLQEWLEKNARGGARYIEQILSHFGVRSSDARLQRPEFLGGGRTPVVISEVLSTFQDPADAGNPQGNMSGHGISVGNQNGFSRRFEEHGYIIGVLSVLPRTSYQQGLPRKFVRFDKFDRFWPEFAHLGEQEIHDSEIFWDAADNVRYNTTFGYQSRYAEYKFGQSTSHGDFRDSLAFWTMTRIFGARPNLNEQFITSDPTQRIFAVEDPSVHKLWVQVFNNVSALRPMPYYGTPSL